MEKKRQWRRFFSCYLHFVGQSNESMAMHEQAEEHLRIIRSLMEKATIYRAISAPTALVGGILASMGAGIFGWGIFGGDGGTGSGWVEAGWFIVPWLGILFLTVMANTFFLWQGSRLRGEAFVSSGMRLALLAMLPGMLCGFFFTVIAWRANWVEWLPSVWMICYGVGLLATKHFGPRSMMILGWSFLVAGLGSSWALVFGGGGDGGLRGIWGGGNGLMGVTFGLFHVIYAGCTWGRSEGAGEVVVKR